MIVAFLYYMALGSLINLARQGTLPVGVAMWLPNLILLALGLSMVMRMERPGDRDIIGSVLGSVKGYVASFRGSVRLHRLPGPDGCQRALRSSIITF